jgi:hypothetical protein
VLGWIGSVVLQYLLADIVELTRKMCIAFIEQKNSLESSGFSLQFNQGSTSQWVAVSIGAISVFSLKRSVFRPAVEIYQEST